MGGVGDGMSAAMSKNMENQKALQVEMAMKSR